MKLSRNPIWALALIHVSVLAFGPQAAGESPLPEGGAMVARMPERSSWTITYHYPEAAGNGAPSRFAAYRPSLVKVEKDGTTYRERVTLRSGKEGERWVVDGREVARLPGEKEVVIVDYGEIRPPSMFSFEETDFGDLDWLSRETLRGAGTYEGRKVLIFAVAGPGEEAGSAVPRLPLVLGQDRMQVAAIDAETHLPLYFSNSWHARTYVFHTSTEPLAPAGEFLAALRKQG